VTSSPLLYAILLLDGFPSVYIHADDFITM
jgi:hypothetical protein